MMAGKALVNPSNANPRMPVVLGRLHASPKHTPRSILESVRGGSVQPAYARRRHRRGKRGRELGSAGDHSRFSSPSYQVPSLCKHLPRAGEPHGGDDECVCAVGRNRAGVLARLDRAHIPVSWISFVFLFLASQTSKEIKGYCRLFSFLGISVKPSVTPSLTQLPTNRFGRVAARYDEIFVPPFEPWATSAAAGSPISGPDGLFGAVGDNTNGNGGESAQRSTLGKEEGSTMSGARSWVKPPEISSLQESERCRLDLTPGGE